ncbi:MAG: hypothetical protein AB7P23_09475, partial [Amphiplicatus sp.]
YTHSLQLLKAKVKLQMQPDGSLKGYVGGYRPWEPVYKGWVNARGAVIEVLTWVQLPGVWHSLKRHADYSPTGPAGEKTHISFAMRVEAVPAFVVTPEGEKTVAQAVSYKALAPDEAVEPPGLGRYNIVDGVVIDPNSPYQAGPDAVILPPSSQVAGGGM